MASAKDNHTFLVATVAHAVNAVCTRTCRSTPAKDFADVALIGTVPQIVLVNKDPPAKWQPLLRSAGIAPAQL